MQSLMKSPDGLLGILARIAVVVGVGTVAYFAGAIVLRFF